MRETQGGFFTGGSVTGRGAPPRVVAPARASEGYISSTLRSVHDDVRAARDGDQDALDRIEAKVTSVLIQYARVRAVYGIDARSDADRSRP